MLSLLPAHTGRQESRNSHPASGRQGGASGASKREVDEKVRGGVRGRLAPERLTAKSLYSTSSKKKTPSGNSISNSNLVLNQPCRQRR